MNWSGTVEEYEALPDRKDFKDYAIGGLYRVNDTVPAVAQYVSDYPPMWWHFNVTFVHGKKT